MLYSSFPIVNFASHQMNAFLQDTYDVHDDEGHCHGSHDANVNDAGHQTSQLHNYFDANAPPPEKCTSLPEVRINVDPTERLIEAIEALRDVVVENTSAQQKQKKRGGRGGGRSGQPLNVKDERLKVRKEKVSVTSF